MEQSPIIYPNVAPIDSYGPGFFRLAGQLIRGAVLVLPTQAMPWGGFGDTTAILNVASDLDVLLVGTGADIAHLPTNFRTTLEEAGIGVETMASPTACRLYNHLVSEGRRVACALLPV